MQGLGRRLFFARRYDEAIEQFKIVLEKQPDEQLVRANLGRTYLFNGMIEPGLTELKAAGISELLAHGYCLAGQKRRALELLEAHKEEWARKSPATSPHLRWLTSLPSKYRHGTFSTSCSRLHRIRA